MATVRSSIPYFPPNAVLILFLLEVAGARTWELMGHPHGILCGTHFWNFWSPYCKEAQAASWRSHMEMFWLRYPPIGIINWQTCEWVSLLLLLSCHPQTWRPQSLWTEISHLHCVLSECLTSRILECNKMVVVLPATLWAYLLDHKSNWNRSPHWEDNIPKGGNGAMQYLLDGYSR